MMDCDCGCDSCRMEISVKCQATSSACGCSISQLTTLIAQSRAQPTANLHLLYKIES